MAVTYRLINDANGQIYLDGRKIKVKSSLTAGLYTYTIEATDGNGWTKSYTGNIVISDLVVISRSTVLNDALIMKDDIRMTDNA